MLRLLQYSTRIASSGAAQIPEYPVYIENGFKKLKAAAEAAGIKDRRVIIIADSVSGPLYAERVKNELAGSNNVSFIFFEAGERNKNLNTCGYLYEKLADERADRKCVVASLGGGVAGDLAGFTAATYMRGLNYFHIPLSLTAMLDSSIGGKVGTDHHGIKNLVGLFYDPLFVYMNAGALGTLPRAEFNSGLAEAIKHGLAADAGYYSFVTDNIDAIRSLDSGALYELIDGSRKIKQKIVSADRTDTGNRRVLNFGHTFGHALESRCGFSPPHGACVAAGIKAAMYLSRKRGDISSEELEKYETLAASLTEGLDFTGVKPDEILQKMRSDKKTDGGKINLVLLKKIGLAYVTDAVPENDIKEAAGYMLAAKG